MLYNKSKNRKVKDKKVLHKIRKKWVVVSSALLMAIGGYAVATHTSSVHADVNGSNNANQNINHNQENVSQLTIAVSKPVNSQKANSQSSNENNANNITDQARQLHSQIIQNSIKTSNSTNVQQTSSASGSVNSSSAVSASSSVDSSNAQGQSSSANGSDYQNNHIHVNLGQMPKRALGETINTSDEGFINVSYRDIDKSDSDYGNTIYHYIQPGVIGQSTNKESYYNYPLDKYNSVKIIQSVPKFTSKLQNFIIGVIPKGAKLPDKQTRDRIVIEYIDDDNDSTVDPHSQQILNKPDSDHWTYSDTTGKSFSAVPYETNTPQGYSLDMKGTEEVSNEQVSGQYSSDNTYQPMQDPHVTYKPGTQLIKIGVKPAAKINIDYIDTANNQTIAHYTDTGATENPFTNATAYETPRDQGGRMPSGYHMVGQAQNVPSDYINGATMTIDVAKNGSVPSDNGSKTPSKDFVTIQYINESDGQPIGQARTFEGPNNQPLSADTISRIKNGTPVGYQFGYFPDYPDGTPVYTPNGTIKADVKKASNQPAPQPSDQSANMQIEYLDQSDGNSLVTAVTAPGKKGQPFNGDQFKNRPYMPTNYHYVGYNGTIPSTYNGSTIVMEIAKNGSNNNPQPQPTPQQTLVDVPINYINQANGQPVGTASDYGISGKPFKNKAQQRVPNGYQYVNIISKVPSTYAPDESMSVLVKVPNSNNNQSQQLINVPIHYIDQSNDQTVGVASDYGINGKPFTDRSQQYVPSGYTYGKVIGSLPTDYGSNEIVNVLVNKIPNGNNQPFSMPVNYVYNGQTKSTVYTAPEVAGTNFDPTNYEHNIPSGYQFADYPTSNPKVYENGKSVTIDVMPVSSNPNQSVNMPVQYISNGKIVGTKTATGTEGSSFDPTQFEQSSDVPSGYQYTGGDVKKPQNFEPNSIVQISVDPINNSHLVKMPIKYVDNGQVIGTSMAPGMSGTTITPSDLSPYEQNVPSGYKYANGQVQSPTDYSDGQTITIPVVPLPKPKSQTVVNMPISYVSNGQQVGTATATGVDGASFNPSQYENNVPRGYYYNSQDDSIQPLVNKYANGQKITINVDPIPQGKSIADMTIDYMNGSQLVTSQSANGVSGTPFNVKPFEHAMNLLPHGYKFEGFSGNVPQTYTNGDTITINVIPKKQINGTQSTITVNYVNGQNQVIESEPVTGWSGQPFDLSNYQSITPGGYRYVTTLQGGNVTRFTPDNQTVDIEVASNQNPTKYGQITVQYRDETSGSLMTNDNYPMTEAIGDPFNLSTFDEAPSGYHITGVYSGNASQFTSTPQYVVLNVAPDTQNNGGSQSSINFTPVTPASVSSNNPVPSSSAANAGYTPASANNTFNPTFNPVINNNNVPQSSSANVSSGTSSNNYVPANTGTGSGSSVSYRNTQGANDEPSQGSTSEPSSNEAPTNQSIRRRINHRGAQGVSQINGNGDNDPEPTPDPTPSTSNQLGTGAGYQHNQTAGTSNVQNGSVNGVNTDPETVGNNDVADDSDAQNGTADNGSRLPQTGDVDHAKAMAAILMALGSSLGALGYAMEKRRRHDN